MATNYKILRKARLEDDLFVTEADEAAWEQEEADRDWAKSVESDVFGEVLTASEAGPKLAREERVEAARQPPPAASEPASIPSESTALVRVSRAMEPEPEPERSWSQVLADLTGNASLEGIRCIGVCGLERASGASEATAAVAHWIAQFDGGPAVVAEAHFGESRLARRFGASETGISDVLLGKSSLDSVIQDTADGNLKLLASGAKIGFFGRGKAVAGAPALIGSLRLSFDTVIVELPAIDDPAFKKLQIGSLVDAVILAASSKTVHAAQLRRGAEALRRSRAILAATMLCSTQTAGASPRAGQFTRMVESADEQDPMFGPLA